MKTIYSIGRDPGCDIYLVDDKNLISRNHAILKIGKGGKYFIIDQSLNGTYINGIKISQGVQVPVSRKDVVSFAHVAELDWSQVPKSGLMSPKTILLSLAAVIVVGALGYCAYQFINEGGGANDIIINPPIAEVEEKEDAEKADSTAVATPPVEQKEVAKPKVKKEVKKETAKEAEKETETKTEAEAEKEVKDTVTYQPFV